MSCGSNKTFFFERKTVAFIKETKKHEKRTKTSVYEREEKRKEKKEMCFLCHRQRIQALKSGKKGILEI